MTASAIPYYVPPEPGRWRAIGLAVIVHAVLFTFLWVGIRWQSDTPATYEVESWSLQELRAAPPPPLPPEPVKEQPPEVKETPVEQPDIAVMQEKKKKHQEEVEKAEQAAEKQKNEAAQAKKLAADKHKQELADEKNAARIHDETINSIRNSTGKIGNDDRSSGSQTSSAWGDRIKAKIKSNTHPGLVSSDTNAPVEFRIVLLPDGYLRVDPQQTKSSGITEFDNAVRRAIDLSQPFPPNSNGVVPQEPFTISYRPKDISDKPKD